MSSCPTRPCSQTRPPSPPTGQDCSLADACANNPCANGARCTNWNSRYNCTCPPGYQGRNCRMDVDECRAPGVCRHGGTCFNTPGSFRCQCPAGFTGHLCESVYMPCAPSQCLNGGTCRQTGELSYECACLPGEGVGGWWGGWGGSGVLSRVGGSTLGCRGWCVGAWRRQCWRNLFRGMLFPSLSAGGRRC